MNEPTVTDLRALVADAIGDALDDLNLTREALNRAADDVLDAVLASGGVSDEDANECARAVAYWLGPAQPIRALVTRAIATACAERDAEIERLRGRRGPDNEAWHEGRKRGSDEAHAAHRAITDAALARAERAEAQVQRVREWASMYCSNTERDALRIALDGDGR